MIRPYRKGFFPTAEMRLMRIYSIAALILFCVTAILPGCAGNRTYLIDLRYIGREESPRSSLMVGVCPFEDLRKEAQPGQIGIRHRRGEKMDLLKAEGMTVSESVTQAVKDYFSERGYKVTDYNTWNKDIRGLSEAAEAISLVVGGNIESFMVEAHSGLAFTETTYKVKLVAFIGQVPEKKVSITTAESSPKTRGLDFDIVDIREKLNTSLTEVIHNLFKDVCSGHSAQN
jgi:hypothetical protein